MQTEKRNLLKMVFLAIFFLLAGSACGGSDAEKTDDGKIYVVATTGMIGDAVQNIGGDKIRMVALMGPGVDPHLYKATQGDLGRLLDADIIFYNGLFLEGKMAEVLEKMSARKKVVAIAESLPKEKLLRFAFGTGTSSFTDDPHIWFDVALWNEAIQIVASTLADADSENADYYRSNAENFSGQLDELHAYVQTRANEIPQEERLLLTAHDAFGYFGRAYGFDVTGLQGISTASEYGLQDVRRVVDIITERRIKAVFVESSVSTRSIDAVVQGARQAGQDVVIGGTLFSDAMGPAGQPAGTYIGMVRHNIDTIVDALQ